MTPTKWNTRFTRLVIFQGLVVHVPLIRMASVDIRERQRVFELFEKLKVTQ
jgi:hypothetical protein